MASIEEEKVYTCNRVSCGKQFLCRMKKKRHQDQCEHTEEVQKEFHVDPISKAYICLKCNRVFSKHSNYYRHKKDCSQAKKKKPKTEHKCNICGKIFDRKAKLETHLKVHNRKKFQCESCGMLFKREGTYINHLQNNEKCMNVQLHPSFIDIHDMAPGPSNVGIDDTESDNFNGDAVVDGNNGDDFNGNLVVSNGDNDYDAVVNDYRDFNDNDDFHGDVVFISNDDFDGKAVDFNSNSEQSEVTSTCINIDDEDETIEMDDNDRSNVDNSAPHYYQTSRQKKTKRQKSP